MSKPSRKIIVTCAVTGAIHTPTMSDALPYRPEDIARQAIDAAQAGAAVLHLHARNPENGSVSIDSEHFLGFLPSIKASTNAVVNLSTGGSLRNTVAERIAPAKRFSPEMCSLNMGSMNFSMHPWRSVIKSGSLTGKSRTCGNRTATSLATPSATSGWWPKN